MGRLQAGFHPERRGRCGGVGVVERSTEFAREPPRVEVAGSTCHLHARATRRKECASVPRRAAVFHLPQALGVAPDGAKEPDRGNQADNEQKQTPAGAHPCTIQRASSQLDDSPLEFGSSTKHSGTVNLVTRSVDPASGVT